MCVMSAIGLALGVAGSLYQGAAQKAAAKYNTAMERRNAEIAKIQGQEQERMQRVNAARQMGYSRAAIGKSGVQRSGSVLDQLSYSAGEAELDAQKIRFGTNENVLAHNARADLYKAQGKQAMMGAVLGAGTSLLTGISGMMPASTAQQPRSLAADLGVSQSSWLVKPDNWMANKLRSTGRYY